MSLKKTLLKKTRQGIGGTWVSDDAFDQQDLPESFCGSLGPQDSWELPNVTEVDLMRHYMELSQRSHGVDNGSYPLGSCTMKYNPKVQDVLSGLEGFRDLHPHQKPQTQQGLMELFYGLQNYLAEITGVDAVSLQPAAGAHGEFTGLSIVKKYFEEKNDPNRKVVLIADSAHGTNPSTATMAGYECVIVPTCPKGMMSLPDLKAALGPHVAAIMLTNPSTLGLFDKNIKAISKMVHEAGALLYYDGANLNALMGITRPGDMGFDIVHVNTHKTFSTPHGGGGPGAGPVGVKSFLEKYLPTPIAKQLKDSTFVWSEPQESSIGRVKAHVGHVSVLIRAYCYVLTMGAEGLKQASENAVLNANYMAHKLHAMFPSVFDELCMHECLLSGEKLPVSLYSFAKRLIDKGIHPPTIVGGGCVYYPERFKRTMLIEPTETESKQSLGVMIESFREVFEEAEQDARFVEQAPYSTESDKIPENAQVVESLE